MAACAAPATAAPALGVTLSSHVPFLFTTSQAEVNAATGGGVYGVDNGRSTNYTGIQCYVFPLPSGQPVPGTVPVYRAYNADGHHIFTTGLSQYQSWASPPPGQPVYWTGEGPQFYILAP